MSKVGILVPLYKSEPSEIELLRLKVSLSSNLEVKKIVLFPKGLSLHQYRDVLKDVELLPWDPYFFLSRDHYNSLMLSLDLYRKLSTLLESIVVCQTDAFLVRSVRDLDQLGHCYIGASWNPPYIVSHVGNRVLLNRERLAKFTRNTYLVVGNGGLSFRNLEFMEKIVSLMAESRYWKRLNSLDNRKMNEDLAISFFGQVNGFSIAPKAIADKIFIETATFDSENIGGIYGFHALARNLPNIELKLLERFEPNSPHNFSY